MIRKLMIWLGFVKDVICSKEYDTLSVEITTLKRRITDMELTSQALYDKVLRKIQKRDDDKKPRFPIGARTP